MSRLETTSLSPNKSPTPRSVREELINDPVFMAREARLKELYRTVGRDHEYTRMHLSQAKNETKASSLASPVPVQRSTKEVAQTQADKTKQIAMRVALQEREGAERSSSSSSLAKALADAESLLLSPIKTATSQDKKATDVRSAFDRSATGGVPPSPSLSKALEEAESLLLADAQSKSSTAAQSAGQSAAAASKSASAPKVNPEATRSVSARKTTKSYTCVQKCLVRAGWQLDSASLGFLSAGEAVDAVSERVLGTGQTRVAFAFSGSRPASGDSATATPSRDDSGFEAVAWVSVKSSSGVTCLAEAKASASPRTIPFLRDKSAALTEWIADGKDMLRFLTVHTKARCESTVVGQVLQQQRFMAQVLSSKESHGETWLGLKLGDMDVAILAATQTKEFVRRVGKAASDA